MNLRLPVPAWCMPVQVPGSLRLATQLGAEVTVAADGTVRVGSTAPGAAYAVTVVQQPTSFVFDHIGPTQARIFKVTTSGRARAGVGEGVLNAGTNPSSSFGPQEPITNNCGSCTGSWVYTPTSGLSVRYCMRASGDPEFTNCASTTCIVADLLTAQPQPRPQPGISTGGVFPGNFACSAESQAAFFCFNNSAEGPPL